MAARKAQTGLSQPSEGQRRAAKGVSPVPEGRRKAVGTNREAAAETVAALRVTGRLEQADCALELAFLTLAAAVDADPANASLWREYRAFEARLRSTGDSDDGAVDAVYAAMRTAMGDTEIP